MMKTYTTLIALSLPLLAASACTNEEVGAPPSYFGNAVEQNIAAQIVNPDAPEINEAPIHVGGRAAIAQQRYLLDEVEKPTATKTSDSEQSGGD